MSQHGTVNLLITSRVKVVSGTSVKEKEQDYYLQDFEDWLYKFENLLHETKAMLQVAIGEAIISGEDDSIEGTGKERMGWGSDFFIKDIKGAPTGTFRILRGKA